jgi:hypothetical protein
MKMRCVVGFWGLFFVGFMCVGCSSVSGNVESAVSFSPPIPVNNLIVGSFTYDINDSYIVRPDGSLILEPTSSTEKKTHEAYSEVEAVDSRGRTIVNQNGTPVTNSVMKNDYHIASYDELYTWAIRCAAESAGITHIIGIKSFLTTTTTGAGGVSVARQYVTLTVYGQPFVELTE